MQISPESFEDRMRLTDEECASIDARLRDPTYQPREVEWLEPPADPFGMNWTWANPRQQSTQVESSPAASLIPLSVSHRWRFRSVVHAGRSVLAASLLIFLGVVLSKGLETWRGNRLDTLSLKVEPTQIQMLGPQQPQPTVTSPIPGFVTAVAINRSGGTRVWPVEGDLPGRPIPVRANEPFRVGPLQPDVQSVVVIITEQPGPAAILQEYGRGKVPPGGVPVVEKQVIAILRGQNYRHLAIGHVDYEARP